MHNRRNKLRNKLRTDSVDFLKSQKVDSQRSILYSDDKPLLGGEIQRNGFWKLEENEMTDRMFIVFMVGAVLYVALQKSAIALLGVFCIFIIIAGIWDAAQKERRKERKQQ